MKILVGSTNPVKIRAVEEAFSKYYDDVRVEGLKVKNDIPNQPIGKETFSGAENRARECKRINDKEKLNAKFFVGIEGGIMNLYGKWFNFGAVCIIDNQNRKGYGTSPWFQPPKEAIEEILNKNLELGEVMDVIEGSKNTKQKDGAIGFLTDRRITRAELFIPGVISAMIPFIHKEFNFD